MFTFETDVFGGTVYGHTILYDTVLNTEKRQSISRCARYVVSPLIKKGLKLTTLVCY